MQSEHILAALVPTESMLMDRLHPGYVKIGPFPNNSDNLKFLLETEAYVFLLDIPLGGLASDSTHSTSLHLRGMLFSTSPSVVISSLPGTWRRKGGINDNIGQPFSISTGAMLSWFLIISPKLRFLHKTPVSVLGWQFYGWPNCALAGVLVGWMFTQAVNQMGRGEWMWGLSVSWSGPVCCLVQGPALCYFKLHNDMLHFKVYFYFREN